jgi:hypothetical protein
MADIAEVFKRYGSKYLELFAKKMPPSLKHALYDITNCRSGAFGFHLNSYLPQKTCDFVCKAPTMKKIALYPYSVLRTSKTSWYLLRSESSLLLYSNVHFST